MSLFKFHDTNYITYPNHPEVVASADTYNGYQFKLVGDTATVFANATEVKTGNGYIMFNIIDKPETWNTDDYKVVSGQYIRAFRLKDLVGQKLDMSSDLVTDTYSTVSVGDKFVGRSTADTTSTFKWKKDAASDYNIYLEVMSKSTFGTFTSDGAGGTVAGGYVVIVRAL